MSPLPPATITVAGEEDTQQIIFAKRRCMCSWMPCFQSETSSSWWEKVRSSGSKQPWWKKAREWSEILAGPKWKTFIRRFNNNKARAVNYAKHGSFHYDPLSYALNFDDGNAAKATGDDDYGYGGFSGRFASVPAKASVDHGKDAQGLT